jgi:hypothetical protein
LKKFVAPSIVFNSGKKGKLRGGWKNLHLFKIEFSLFSWLFDVGARLAQW